MGGKERNKQEMGEAIEAFKKGEEEIVGGGKTSSQVLLVPSLVRSQLFFFSYFLSMTNMR